MITWNNLDTLEAYKELSNVKKVNLAEVMTGENGAERVKNYSVPMAAGLAYNYAAKQVDDDVLEALKKLAKEAQLTEKYAALYNGEVGHPHPPEYPCVGLSQCLGRPGQRLVKALEGAPGGAVHQREGHHDGRKDGAVPVHDQLDAEMLHEEDAQWPLCAEEGIFP